MSRYCAKPTCSEFVHTWFEMSREAQRVVKRNTSSKHAIGLCESHADRFEVPAGWTLEDGDQSAASDAVGSKKKSGTETPWFLPKAPASSDSESSPPRAPIEGSDDSVSQLDNTEEGTMLDRAFHGPRQRESSQNAPSKQSDSKARVPGESEEESAEAYSTGEIPFPPSGQPVASI